MPLNPLTVALSEGQQIDALKRFRRRYGDELAEIEAKITEILTALAEADYLVQFLGEQPEVKDLRSRRPELEILEKRREHLGRLIDRLDAVLPRQADVVVPPPGGGGSAPQRGGVRRF